jgi:IclR family acetate operon transcriptional repressor
MGLPVTYFTRWNVIPYSGKINTLILEGRVVLSEAEYFILTAGIMGQSQKQVSALVNKTSGSSVGQVRSLTRGLLLLQRLSETSAGLGLTEIAGSLGLAPSTAHRLLNSMRQLDFVDFDEATGQWLIGVNAFVVGNAYLKTRDFVAQARPFMKQLVTETGETCNLAILDGESHVYVAQVECSEVMRLVVQLGSRGKVHASAVGKALLSSMPENEVMRIIQSTGLPRLTNNTLRTPAAFVKELQLVRERGYAIDDEEQAVGLRCIAVNIYDEHCDAVGAISVSGPTARITNNRFPELSAAVVKNAAQISHAIGGQKPDFS